MGGAGLLQPGPQSGRRRRGSQLPHTAAVSPVRFLNCASFRGWVITSPPRWLPLPSVKGSPPSTPTEGVSPMRLSASAEWTGDLEREFRDRLEELMPRNNPGVLNAAVMQLGQLVCTPKNPECAACPLARCCRALESGLQREIPAGRRAAAYPGRKPIWQF